MTQTVPSAGAFARDRTAAWADPQSWFEVRDLGEGFFLIAEPGHINSFLVLGSERALLFDTGMGIAPISAVVSGLTDLPLIVVNSHDHLDHRGGNADLVAHAAQLQVQDLCAHPAGRHDEVDSGFIGHYVRAMSSVVEDHRTYRALDEQHFFALDGLPAMRDLPDLTGWNVSAVAPTRRLDDQERIDLGGRALTVLHTPGHAPDAIALWDESTGTLLGGDTVLAAAHWLHGDGADPVAFAASTERLAGLDASRVLVAHNLRYQLPGDRVTAVAHAARAVADGVTTPQPGRDLLGNPASRHEVDSVALLLPAPLPEPTPLPELVEGPPPETQSERDQPVRDQPVRETGATA